MPGLSALLVVGGPGPSARPPMGGGVLPRCPPPSLVLRMFLGGGGRALVLSPFLMGSLHFLAAPDHRWGRCPQAVLCCATQRRALPCCAVMYCTALYCVVLCCAVLCCAALCCVVTCCVVSHRAVVCGGKEDHLVPCSSMVVYS